jgi:hypothetical protein
LTTNLNTRFRTSVLALIVFVHFLRLRYFLSSYTREALLATTNQLDKWLLTTTKSNNTALTIISNIYISIKRLVARYGAVPSLAVAAAATNQNDTSTSSAAAVNKPNE